MSRIINEKESVHLLKKLTKKSACVLMMDGKYFGYDQHPAHTASLFSTIKDAYIFEQEKDTESIVHMYKMINKEVEHEIIFLHDKIGIKITN